MYICFANTDGLIYGYHTIIADQQQYVAENVDSDATDVDAASTMYEQQEQEQPNEYEYTPQVWQSTDELSFTHLGAVSLNKNGFVIVDRYPQQITSQLNMDSVLDVCYHLITELYEAHIISKPPISFYLPRMYSDMISESLAQYHFQTLFLEKSILKGDACTAKQRVTHNKIVNIICV